MGEFFRQLGIFLGSILKQIMPELLEFFNRRRNVNFTGRDAELDQQIDQDIENTLKGSGSGHNCKLDDNGMSKS